MLNDYVRTHPDDGITPSRVLQPDIDMAEIAARLGAPRFRREGRILSYADFSPSMDGWRLSHQYTYTFRTSTRAMVGTSSVLMVASGSQVVYLEKAIPRTTSLRIGVEAFFQAIEANTYAEIRIYYSSGQTVRTYAIRLNHSTGAVDYLDQDLQWVNITSHQAVSQSTGVWYNAKLVIDAETNSYIRVLINDSVYDIVATANITETPYYRYGFVLQILAYAIDILSSYSIAVDAPVVTVEEH